MKVGVIGAGTMGQGIAKAFAQVEGYTVALCDIKQEWADNGKAKIAYCASFPSLRHSLRLNLCKHIYIFMRR